MAHAIQPTSETQPPAATARMDTIKTILQCAGNAPINAKLALQAAPVLRALRPGPIERTSLLTCAHVILDTTTTAFKFVRVVILLAKPALIPTTALLVLLLIKEFS